MRLEEMGLIGDLRTAALVGAEGSINWLCFPRFDSPACFAALLGDERNGRWRIAPTEEAVGRQRYRPDSLVLETEFATREGRVRVTDFMPINGERHDLVRIVEGLAGKVTMRMELVFRFDYGWRVPWVQRSREGLKAVAGSEALLLRCDVPTVGRNMTTRSEFTLAAGERETFGLTWFASNEEPPPEIDPDEALRATDKFWREWSSHCTYRGPWREAVMRSLITLKALTYEPTGGIVAAATTSLPEKLGGVRNWDYRFCWLRDATFTLYSFLHAGYTDEAAAWSEWLLRTVAGDPAQLRMLYGVAGERVPSDLLLDHLPGYEGAKPVRIGNTAARQFQLDVYGEVMDTLQLKREVGLRSDRESWSVQRHFAEFVIRHWDKPDEGIWEVRGPRRHFTHSKVMAWVALDRAIKAVERFGLRGDVARWRKVRDQIHATVCEQGYDRKRGVFTQYFGADSLDASLLLMPLVGFLPVADKRIRRTIDAIRRELVVDGFVLRYHPADSSGVDGLPPGEGAFLPCSFWLVDCLCLIGKRAEARRLFERLLALRNPLGLLSEEFDPHAGRLVGNFPQAFSHVAMINSAQNLTRHVQPAAERSAGAKSSVKAKRSSRTSRRQRTL